jgi:hypothetical protein
MKTPQIHAPFLRATEGGCVGCAGRRSAGHAALSREGAWSSAGEWKQWEREAAE